MAKIQARLVIEILGRPPEHIKSAISSIIDKMGSDKGVSITEKNIHEPIPLENSKGLFTTFAEVLVEFDSLQNYFTTIFTYMPAHIEIISPEEVPLSNSQLNEVGNGILQRLHNYDSLVKGIINERAALINKINELAPEVLKQLSQPQSQQPQQQPNAEQKEEEKPAKQKKQRKASKKKDKNPAD